MKYNEFFCIRGKRENTASSPSWILFHSEGSCSSDLISNVHACNATISAFEFLISLDSDSALKSPDFILHVSILSVELPGFLGLPKIKENPINGPKTINAEIHTGRSRRKL